MWPVTRATAMAGTEPSTIYGFLAAVALSGPVWLLVKARRKKTGAEADLVEAEAESVRIRAADHVVVLSTGALSRMESELQKIRESATRAEIRCKEDLAALRTEAGERSLRIEAMEEDLFITKQVAASERVRCDELEARVAELETHHQ